MIRLSAVYVLAGLMFAAVAIASARDRGSPGRYGSTAFWGLLAASFLFGSRLGDLGNGILVLALAAVGGTGLMRRGHNAAGDAAERERLAVKFGNRLFLPALIVPAVALVGTLTLKRLSLAGAPLVEPGQETLVALALGIVIALLAAMAWLRPAASVPLQEGRRLLDSIASAAILP